MCACCYSMLVSECSDKQSVHAESDTGTVTVPEQVAIQNTPL